MSKMQFLYKEGHLNRGDDHLNCGGITSIVVGTGLSIVQIEKFVSSGANKVELPDDDFSAN